MTYDKASLNTAVNHVYADGRIEGTENGRMYKVMTEIFTVLQFITLNLSYVSKEMLENF
jgi:hypothetical protein